MAQLPYIQTQDQTLSLIQTKWRGVLNPAIANPLLQGQILNNQALAIGTTIINHGLGRPLLGYLVIGKSKAADISDNQANNQTPDLTLSLTSSAACKVNLYVF